MSDNLQAEFFSSLKNDRTVLIGTGGQGRSAMRPMTAQVDDEGDHPGIYFFASREEGIGADVLAGKNSASLAFASKGHELFAGGHGVLKEVTEQQTIDRLWSPLAAVYYEQGREDPNLILLKLDTAEFDLWRSTTTGFLKSIAYKLMGKDAGEANPQDRGSLAI